MINDFRGGYAFLSNFYHSPLVLDGFRYPTGEHAYQAQKEQDSAYKNLVANAQTPREAKTLGRQATLREDWELVKEFVMDEVVRAKFTQNPDLAERLKGTWGHRIVEGNTWHDQEWGDCTCPKHIDTPGKNGLGLILMTVRAELVA